MKRTTNDTMKCSMIRRMVASVALAAALAPSLAYAATDAYVAVPLDPAVVSAGEDENVRENADGELSRLLVDIQDNITEKSQEIEQLQLAEAEKVSKTLPYNRADIDAIGTQESTGHSICCPSFSCAYADAVLDGTVNDHGYYTCSCCAWTDWGGGDSSFRCVGDSEELLREAYDQIAAGYPTVIHVSAGYGEHWVALIGYTDAFDSDHLTLENFIALDPWDGAQINAADRFALYGDGCEHVSERAI